MIEKMRKIGKIERWKNAKKGKKGHKMSIFHEKDGYLHVPSPDV
jgi:hypothetical protein